MATVAHNGPWWVVSLPYAIDRVLFAARLNRGPCKTFPSENGMNWHWFAKLFHDLSCLWIQPYLLRKRLGIRGLAIASQIVAMDPSGLIYSSMIEKSPMENP